MRDRGFIIIMTLLVATLALLIGTGVYAYLKYEAESVYWLIGGAMLGIIISSLK